MDGIILGPELPNSFSKSRRSLTLKTNDNPEDLLNISKSPKKSSIGHEVQICKESKRKSLISSTINLFKSASDILRTGCSSTDNIEHVEIPFYLDNSNPSNYPKKQHSISIGLFVEEICSEKALPSESVSIPLETPTKLFDEYESKNQATSIMTKASIEQHRDTGVTISPDHVLELKKKSKEARSLQSRNSVISLSGSKDAKKDNSKNLAEGVKCPSNHCTFEKEYINKRKYEERLNRVNWSSDENFGDFKANVKKQPFKKGCAFDQIECTIHEILGKAVNVSDLDHNSSESERDSEIEFIKSKAEKVLGELSDERRRLFYEESFEEDTLFVPTTLPLEKAIIVPIFIKRHQDVRYVII